MSVENDYSGASLAYDLAKQTLDLLQADKSSVFQQLMQQGTNALSKDDHLAAAKAAETALAIDPLDGAAQHLLIRSKNRETVLQLYRQALSSLENDELEQAKHLLGQALALDPEYAPVSTAHHQLEARISEQAFSDSLSRFQKALSQGDLEHARDHLGRAASIRPNDPAVLDSRHRLDNEILARKLNDLQNLSRQQATDEQWQQAAQTCQQALAISPTAGFAQQCSETAALMLELHGKIDAILDRPDRTQIEAILTHAEQTLEWARSIHEPGAKLVAKTKALENLVAKARTPIPLTLLSDQETNVLIYHVGRLGQFREKRLTLRPGAYTIVGSRPGYRDVRFEVKLSADTHPTPVMIRCEEPI